jgi:hypothetical protein
VKKWLGCSGVYRDTSMQEHAAIVVQDFGGTMVGLWVWHSDGRMDNVNGVMINPTDTSFMGNTFTPQSPERVT